jgi:5-formyltetrahydrofolate cyclo-ligase
MITKRELRQAIRRRNQRHAAGESSSVIAKLQQDEHFRHAHTLLLYSALPDEVPTQQLIDELTAQGRHVVLPRVISDTEMELRRYTGRGDLQQGAFGIMEPVGELFTDYASIDVAVIPGMAFDREGHRLGRGRGYYDRFLSRVPYIYKIGVCFPSQLVDNVPTDSHDILMDCIVC